MKTESPKKDSKGTPLPQKMDYYDKKWYQHYVNLIDYKKKHGDCLVPQGSQEYKVLGKWVAHQRRGKEKMPSWRRELLDGLGFIWQVNKSPRLLLTWEENLESLQGFYEKEGHFDVPKDWKGNPILWEWVRRQKYLYHENKLSKNRRQKLLALGLPMENKIRSWRENYDRLKAFSQKNGTCNIPIVYEDDTPLGWWVEAQRKYYHQGILSLEKQQHLEELGFEWEPLELQWEEKYQELSSFYEKEGRTEVSRKENRVLGDWVHFQRQRRKEGKLSQERIQNWMN